MAGIRVKSKSQNETLKLQSSLGLVNEIYSGKNKWLISRMNGTTAIKWQPKNHELEERL